jgi:hypothetical protein
MNPTKGHFGYVHYARDSALPDLIGTYDSDKLFDVVQLPWEWNQRIRSGESMFLFPVHEEPNHYMACVPLPRYLDPDIHGMIPHESYVYKTSLMHPLNHSKGFVHIPEVLASRARIRDGVVMVGMLDYIEFWNPVEFDRHLRHISGEGLDALAEGLLDI